MFEYCVDPDSLSGLSWLSCYLTTVKHQSLYWSILTVLTLLAVTAPLAVALGLAGALARRSPFGAVRGLGWGYTSMVRGIPDLIFFLFVPLAIDQLLEYIRHRVICPQETGPVWVGHDFLVCDAAKLPLGPSPEWVHDMYGFALAVVAFAIVFGAFCANVIHGAMNAVPRAQLETARAYGLSPRQVMFRIHLPQTWIYALPGLSNVWMILIKATPLLFLMGVEDIVYWARELGGTKSARFSDYPHGDWRIYYFSGLLVFYLLFTWFSQIGLNRLTDRVSRGQATLAGGKGGVGR